jgi:predicted nucleotide-binding protein
MDKPTLFIGSSTESKWIVQEIHDILSKQNIEVKVWYKGTFYPGDSTLETLGREVLLSEFALLVVYPDDEIIKREERGYTARDNVLFELGLFTGAFGRRRSFCLAVRDEREGKSKKVFIPTDLRNH